MELSPVAKLAWDVACRETTLVERQYVDPEQLLAAMTKLRQLCSGLSAQEARAKGIDTVALEGELELVASILDEGEIDPDALRHELREKVEHTGYRHTEGVVIHRSDRLRAVHKRAEQIAQQMRLDQLTVAPLFIGILEEKGALVRDMLAERGVDVASLIDATRERVCPKVKKTQERVCVETARPDGRSATPWLDCLGYPLTEKARKDELGPAAPRNEEIQRVLQVLARNAGRNPVLVGQPGTGRTAIVQALAIQGARGNTAGALDGKAIVQVDGSSLMSSGESARQRLLDLIGECRANPHIVLYVQHLRAAIDSRHEWAGIFRAALGRGDLRCIGVATPREYERYIDSDPMMSRLFERVNVGEPDRVKTRSILDAIRSRWEQGGQVTVSSEALDVAIDLSARFDLTHRFPDKAIKVLNEACEKALVPDAAERATQSGSASPTRAPLRLGSPRPVTIDAIVRILSERTGIPWEVIAGWTRAAGSRDSHLSKMEGFLASHVLGQDDVIRKVCKYLIAAYSAIGEEQGPLGVFLFVGPPGTGKTTLVRSLAEFLNRGDEGLARFDMSAYSDEVSAARFLGRTCDADSSDGLLAHRLRQTPHSIILLEHIEKSHPRVLAELPSVFREGRLEGRDGSVVDARLATFIMESNTDVPSDPGTEQGDLVRQRNALLKQWSQFCTHGDDLIVFKALDPSHVRQIITWQLDQIKKKFAARRLPPVHYVQPAIDCLMSCVGGENLRMQDLERTMYRLVEVPLAQLVETRRGQGCEGIVISADGGQLRIEPLAGSIPTL